MLKKLAKEAEDAKADPDWLKWLQSKTKGWSPKAYQG
jgi:hypothetical protein